MIAGNNDVGYLPRSSSLRILLGGSTCAHLEFAFKRETKEVIEYETDTCMCVNIQGKVSSPPLPLLPACISSPDNYRGGGGKLIIGKLLYLAPSQMHAFPPHPICVSMY